MTESPFGSVPQQPAGEPPRGGAGAASPRPEESEEAREGLVFRDKRRIDPETFEPRAAAAPPPAAPAQGAAAEAPDAEADPAAPGIDPATEAKVAELTADLQRLSAEYANYRRRVERDREAQRELTVAAVMGDVLPILDDVGRARDHGELEGGFKAVGEAVEAMAAKQGLTAFGAEGEPFDPTVHEAMTSTTAPDVTEPTVTAVYQVGYRLRDRIVRPARVGVTDAE